MGRFARWSLVALALAGCGDAALRAELADMRRRLDERERRAAAADRQIDELSNRVFLLTDQVESQKVAAVHRTLPVVTLKPEAPDDDAQSSETSFEGAASSADPEHTRRPSLRLQGSARAQEPSRTSHRLGAAPDPLPASDVNLGVAPAPPIDAASRGHVEHAAPAVEPLQLYRTAYDDLRAGRHDAAVAGFRDFVRRFPRHDYADNAQYWLGECFYDRQRYAEAAPEFRAVVTRWPTGNKAPDAMLKLAYTLLALGEDEKGRATLRAVPATYPHTEAARLAQERLAQLQEAGK